MPGYVPHTPADQQAMLERIGLSSLEDLFASIPASLRVNGLLDLPPALSEPEAVRELARIGAKNMDATQAPCFSGDGVYRHFTPSLVPAIMGRAEFFTSYTPYQPERSQGMLQSIYEFQTLTCQLLGMEVANASMYDGASALAEAVVMACSIKGINRAIIPTTLHPAWTKVVRTYAQGQSIEVVLLPHEGGVTDLEAVRAALETPSAALVIPQPNCMGRLEPVQTLAEEADKAGALVIAAVNPIAMALLKPPGEWPADIAVAEGQALGLPMNYGGPLVGLFACRRQYIRQMPGRLVGATVDGEGRRAYTLTLQTREQHIRREKASSNICTNEALFALGATVYMALLGRHGMKRVAELCVERAHEAYDAITALPGWEPVHPGPFFHEFAVRAPLRVPELNAILAGEGIIGPVDLEPDNAMLEQTALFCCTEMITPDDIGRLVGILRKL